jgi:hypothetical protein
MNSFQYAVAAWLPIVIFPQTMAPSFREELPNLAMHSLAIMSGLTFSPRLRVPDNVRIGHCGDYRGRCDPTFYLA